MITYQAEIFHVIFYLPYPAMVKFTVFYILYFFISLLAANCGKAAITSPTSVEAPLQLDSLH